MTDEFELTSQEAPKIQVRASLNDPDIVLHQPVFVDFTVSNGYEQAMFLDLGGNFREAFLFSVELPNGTTQKIPPLHTQGISLIGKVTIGANKEYKKTILLNEWFTAQTPGGYIIKGRLDGPSTLEDGSKLTFESNFQFQMTVMPENVVRLEEASKRIFGRLLNSQNYGDAAEAALALTYVNHSVATPFLKKAIISDKMVESVIINSLRVRGGTEAVEVLGFAIDERPNSETAAHAISALKWIERYSSDDVLKRKIQSRLHDRN